MLISGCAPSHLLLLALILPEDYGPGWKASYDFE